MTKQKKFFLNAYFFYKTAYLLAYLPRFILNIISKSALLMFYYTGLRGFKRNVYGNLKVITREKDAERLKKLTKKFFINYAEYLIDFFKMPRYKSVSRLNKLFYKTPDFSTAEELLKKGKGLIIYSGHIGNWELGGYYMACLGYRIVFVLYQEENKRFEKVINDYKKRKNIEVLIINNKIKALKEILKRLRENKVIALLGDRNPDPGRGAYMEFFEKKIKLPYSPAKLAAISGAPVLPVYVLKTNEKYKIKIYDSFYVQKNASKEEVISQSRELIFLTESVIKKHPLNWYIFYDYFSNKDKET